MTLIDPPYVRVEFKMSYTVPRKYAEDAERELVRAFDDMVANGDIVPDIIEVEERDVNFTEMRQDMISCGIIPPEEE